MKYPPHPRSREKHSLGKMIINVKFYTLVLVSLLRANCRPEDGKMCISENPYIALHESGTWLCHNFDGNVDREKLAI